MQVTVSIETDNAAFEDDWEGEVSLILADLGKRLNPDIEGPYNLHDSNGNHVGEARITA